MKSNIKMKWCTKCVLPNTRPNLKIFSNGLCSICSLKKKKINWNKRLKILKKIIYNVKRRSKSNYDCVIPVSGGKDSYWQVLTALKFGLKPLAITWKPSGRNQLGEENLKNLIKIGVDHIDYSINPKIEKYFLLKALKEYGSIGIPMHLAIFNISYRVAYSFDIPLVIWGENPSSEYGYQKISETQKNPSYDYFMKHNITKNKKANFWRDKILKEKDLNAFNLSSYNKLKKSVKSIFLGDYIKWDPKKVYKQVKSAGFKEGKVAKTGYYNFADLDDDFISIHHYLKWYKFGFTRLFDNLSIEIRNKRIKRKDAIKIILSNKAKKPTEDIKKFCKFTNISNKKFESIVEKFRNKKIWFRNKKNKWFIKNFLINNYSWD